MIIYKATNKIDGKCYIGQTFGLLHNRIVRHIRDSKKKKNIYFHNSIIKYGIENFKWCILEFCYSQDELNEKEQWYIKHFNSFGDNGYNMTSGGEKCIFSDDVKKKLSEQRKGRIPWNKGKKVGPMSEETKKRLSESGKNKSKETIQKMSEAAKKREEIKRNKRKTQTK